MTNIQAKLEQLFEFERKLNETLEREEYELFFQQQALFGDQVKDFLNKHSQTELNNELKQLKRLKSMIKLLQEKSEAYTKTLKEQSLLLQRNKNKIKAYK